MALSTTQHISSDLAKCETLMTDPGDLIVGMTTAAYILSSKASTVILHVTLLMEHLHLKFTPRIGDLSY